MTDTFWRENLARHPVADFAAHFDTFLKCKSCFEMPKYFSLKSPTHLFTI